MFPYVTLDKSVLQALTHEQLDELSNVFEIICVPTLTREIIADLRRAPSRSQQSTAEQRVQDLARRMSTMHLVTPITYRKLVLENLFGTPVPLNGQIPLDMGARNVTASPDGRQLVYDSTLEQDLWKRWARGDFSISDQEKATLWRDELAAMDVKQFNKSWSKFSNKYIGRVRSIEEAIARVDELLASTDLTTVSAVMAVLFVLLRVTPPDMVMIALGHALQRGLTIWQIAPYAASVARIYLVFMAVSNAQLVPQRATNEIDIQYLFYAPFGQGFASGDGLHESLWPAVTSKAVFVKGDALQADLAARVVWRAQFATWTEEEQKKHYAEYANYPVELPDSPINAVWAKGFVPREKMVADLRNRRSLAEVEAEVGPKLRQMMEQMKALQKLKPEDAGDWPLGPRPGYEKPTL